MNPGKNMITSPLPTRYFAACVMFLLGILLLPVNAEAAATPASQPIVWEKINKGLEIAVASPPQTIAKNNPDIFIAARITPSKRNFMLCMASELGSSRSFPQWSKDYNLQTGINGGMYLTDKVTNIGYMRNGTSINNSKIGGRLGAFFVSGRRNTSVRHADILDKDHPKWRSLLDSYGSVAQNYRLLNSAGHLLWEKKKDEHSIAVIAKDKKNRILFILCQEPLSVGDFTDLLKTYIPDISTVMYVEGGAQAGMFLRLPSAAAKPKRLEKALSVATTTNSGDDTIYTWKGRQSLLRVFGNAQSLLPNIIGITKI